MLLRFLESDSFRNGLAAAAIRAMRSQDDPAYVAPLLTSLQQSLQQREPAFTTGGSAEALGTLAFLARNETDKTAVREFLTDRTHHPKQSIKRAALRALGELGDPRAIAVLETFATAAKDSPERKTAEKSIADLRARKKPVDDLRDLRNEVLGLQRENRELRRSVETLTQQFTESAQATEKKKQKKKKKP
ncbi:MAG: HEAT repeat domain-containing protein [Limisphaerales bacterium]